MLYEIWIDNFRLPVIPKEINTYEENEVSSVTIDGFGEISKTTNLKVRTFELSSFFYDPTKGKPPYAKEYTISVNSFEDINKFFHSIQRNNKVVPFKIFGLDIDTRVQIVKYTWGTRDGSSDIYYDLSLIEYKEASVESTNEIKEKRTNQTPYNISKSNTYIVKSGDTLYNIAKKVYGDGNKYLELAEKNGISNPNFILDGQELKI